MANFPFPWRAEELPSNTFWFRSGSDGWDFNAQRRTANGWDVRKPNPSDPVENQDSLAYGMPVYAITDGSVVSSWRNAPENPRPGESHPGRLSDPKTIPRSGNHVLVLTDDGSAILYAHMTTGSVPAELCPSDDEFVTNAEDKVTPSGAPREVPRETMLPPPDRPRVQRGQFLGRVGNSGASSGPHLHMDRVDAAGEADRFSHDRAWRSSKNEPDDWKPFNGHIVDADDKSVVILASPLLRRGDASAGGFGEVALHFVRSRRLVTALRDEGGDLRLITWGMTPPEQIQRRGDISAGRASKIAIAEPRSDIVVTALRDGDGTLRLISWRIETNGEITRCAHAVAGPASQIALTTPREGVVVSAVRTESGDLKLIAWTVATDGAITRRGDAEAGAAGDLAMTVARPFAGVVTAVRTGAGNLKLIAWQVSENGGTIIRRGEADAGVIGAVAIVSRGSQGQFLLTALRDSGGNLRVVSWRLTGDGSIERLGTATAGQVSEVDVAGVPGASQSAVVACRDDNGRLRILTWELSSDGRPIARWGGGLAGSASQIQIAGTSDAGRNFFVTSCADSDGNLKLINWEANL